MGNYYLLCFRVGIEVDMLRLPAVSSLGREGRRNVILIRGSVADTVSIRDGDEAQEDD